jgi:hypothetical protein
MMGVVVSLAVLGLRSMAAAILLVSVLYLSSAFVGWLIPRHHGPAALRLAATALSCLWILGVAFNVLLTLHAFTLAAAMALFTTLAVAVVARRGTRTPSGAFPFVLGLRRWWRGGRWRNPWLTVSSAAVGLCAVRVLFVPPVAWDSLTYHLVKAALWVRDGGPIAFRAPGGGGIYMGVPGGGDALWAWVMLPFHSDLLVGVADVAGTVLLGLGVYVMARELGVRSRHAALSAAFVLATPSVLLAAGSNYVDNLTAFFLVAGTAFVLRFLQRGAPGWAVLAGMAFGAAASAKLTGVPMLAVAILAIILGALRAPRGKVPITTVVAAVGAAVLVCAPWYLQNWIRTGYPFSPFPVRLGGWVLGTSPDFDWYLAQSLSSRPYTFTDEFTALARMIHAPLRNTLGAVTTLPLIMLPVTTYRLWKRMGSRAFFVLGLLACSLANYWDPGFAVTRLGWSAVNGRYFLWAVALAVSLGFTVSPGPPYSLVLGLGIAVNLWVHGGLFWTGLELNLVLSFSLIVLVLAWSCSRLDSPRRQTIAAGIVGFLALAAAQEARDAFRATLASTATLTHSAGKFPEAALQAIDGHGIRLAFTSGPYQVADNWYIYPFLGSRLQNEPVYIPISHSGQFVPHTDPTYLTDADRDAWLGRLESERVAAVVSFPPAGPELAWMEAAPERFRPIAGTAGRWGLFERLR